MRAVYANMWTDGVITLANATGNGNSVIGLSVTVENNNDDVLAQVTVLLLC